MKKHPASVPYDEWKVDLFRRDPKLAVEYLNQAFHEAFAEDDPELIMTALATLVKAYGFTTTGKLASIPRVSLHKMLSQSGNPEWKNVFRILKALSARMSMEVVVVRAKKPVKHLAAA